MKIGCHVSISGGVFNAPANAKKLGCEVFQIFTRSPQGGPAPKLTAEVIAQFKDEMKKNGYAEAMVHTPYFINFGSSVPRIFHGSVSIVRGELDRASLLGIPYVVTHLGSNKDLGDAKCFPQMCGGLVELLKDYDGSAMLLLENAAGSGEVIGDRFEELAAILDHPKLIKYEIGVCFDTCHAFASGYDLRTDEDVKKTLSEFDRTVGLERLRAIHANDSKFDLGERRDRHEHIGRGKIGLEGFRAIMRHPKLAKLNMYLETEHDLVKKDIKTLKSMRD